ncbi:ABC transporter permease [Frigoribacterium sp. CFBP 8751]|uniref:ABC transporter permease n=1 Tax=Frigoribacterium sp. CFBP 8751 TaxID=2775277 RepID=UPI001783F149|nr:ABC transporter permease [Frigoribacterium sp. CFBP 8751]MBD8538474.1 ABC transporter permease [Frigoribacterium sp. CFBP 8751]
MVAELLRLRLQTIGNTVRFGPRRLTVAVASVLAVLIVTIAVASLVSGLRDAPLDDVRALAVGGGSLLLVGFAVVPFATVRPAWSDPRRLAVLGVSEGGAAVGLALGAAIGLPTLALLVLSTGYVRAWGEGTGVAAIAVVGALVAGVTALLLALVASTLNSVVLTSRRGRELALVGAVLVVLLAVPVIVDLVRLSLPGRSGTGVVADALAWTPFGAALALPGHVAAGQTGRVVADVAIAVVSLVALWLAWRALVARAFVDRPEPEEVDDGDGLGWFEYVRASPTGAVAGRSLTYWMRDARYRMSLVIIPFLPLLVVPLGIAGVSWNWLALVPVPIMCLILGFLPHNDVAYDSTALWMHVASDTRGLADRVGRLAPPLLIGVPLVVLGSVVATWLFGDWQALPSELGVSAGFLLSGLGLSSLVSALMPYATVRPHDDPFQQPQSNGATAAWAQTVMIGGAVLATAPALWFAGRGLITGYPAGGTWALALGVGVGLVVLVAGVALGARVFSRRAPELLAFALRS